MPTRRPERLKEALVLLGLVVALAYVGSMVLSTEGHVVPQIVDLYLVCQYAKGFAEGHPFQYNAGEPPTTGSTSLLYTAFLGIAHAAGARGEALVAVAIGSGIVFYLGSIWLAFRIARHLAGDRAAVLSAALLCLGGPSVWGYLYGSDVGLFMFLSLWLLERLVSSWGKGSAWGFVLPAALLALARPEGLVIGLLVGCVWVVRARRLEPLVLLPTSLGLLWLLLNRGLTGQWLGTSVAEKSLGASYGLRDTLALVSEYLFGVLRGILLGFYPPEAALGFSKGLAPFYLPPLCLVFVGIAAGARRFAATPLRPWLATVLVVVVLGAPNVYMGAHFNRYIMWCFPTLLVLTAVGLEDFSTWASHGGAASAGTIFRGCAAVMLASGLLATARFGSLYGELAGGIYRRDVAAARWIERAVGEGRLPRDAVIANDVTSIEYLTGHRNLNLHGVTSRAFLGNRPAEREAGIFESLSRLKVEERPQFLLTSRTTQDSYPSLKALVEEPPIFETTSGSDEILLLKMRTSPLGRNAALYREESRAAVQGLREVDRLNICDSSDEKSHGYVFRSRLGDLALNGAVRSASYPGEAEPLQDAGRPILGEESFTVRTQPGHDLVVILRTSLTAESKTLRAAGPIQLELGFTEAAFVVAVDDRPWSKVSFHPREGWEELAFRLPGSWITGTQTKLRLSGRYSSFYYWFFQ